MSYDETDRFQERAEVIAALALKYALWVAFLCAMFTLMAVTLFDKSRAMWLGFKVGRALTEPTHFAAPADQTCLPSPRLDPPL